MIDDHELEYDLFHLAKYNLSGDFDPESQEPDHVVCVDNVVDFTSAFLFSVETQHTIGYEEEVN